jgi:hypothetical protein
LDLLAPYKSKKREKEPWPRFLVRKSRRIETVIRQLVERYRAEKFRALRPSTIRARHAPRSPHFERMGKERIYPFLCQMAKVELHALG